MQGSIFVLMGVVASCGWLLSSPASGPAEEGSGPNLEIVAAYSCLQRETRKTKLKKKKK